MAPITSGSGIPNGIHKPLTWTPSSWRDTPAKQEVIYEDKSRLTSTIKTLNEVPPIVSPYEIENLKSQLKDCAEGNAFLLQGGDCAELFDYCQMDTIESKVKLVLQMSLILIYGGRKKVVRVLRMAGQYAKPRSSPTETVNGVSMQSFRGDILNSFEADPKARELDPGRLLEAYFHSAATLNYTRSALSSGIADMHAPLDWSLGHPLRPKLVGTFSTMRTKDVHLHELSASPPTHTGAYIRKKSHSVAPLAVPELYYNTSSHFLWIGDRTRQLDHAHVEYFRGIANPIGVKVGPTMPANDIVPLLDILNPNCEVGKVVLITRYGCAKIAAHLPTHIKAIQESRHNNTVVWQCDPMHGNGRNAVTSSGKTIKTRSFDDVLSELQQALQIHRQHGSYLGGMHLEMTGDNVTECIGGAENLTEEDLSLRYTTFCDPRLNEKQALELAFLVAGFYRET
ncbi:hypothetical protein LTR66_017505 [Elasticomyces elasticus]|nr:hypothetical protein LTR66_017505 [Elasticomyces elasticus]